MVVPQRRNSTQPLGTVWTVRIAVECRSDGPLGADRARRRARTVPLKAKGARRTGAQAMDSKG